MTVVAGRCDGQGLSPRGVGILLGTILHARPGPPDAVNRFSNTENGDEGGRRRLGNMVHYSLWLSKVSPQGHFISELGICDGKRSPRCRAAYFAAVRSR